MGSRPNRSSIQTGFTVIETMIVLAIAAFILLIVLEALPALQRNGRNNSRKQDVSTILEAVSHWELANSGNLPKASDPFLQYSKLYIYDTSSVTLHADSAGAPPSVPANNNVNVVNVYNYQKCDTLNAGASISKAAGYSDVVAIYAVETNSGSRGHCQQL